MSIRVLHIIGSLRLGGAQTCLKSLVENIPADKIETYIYPLRSRIVDIPIRANLIKLPYHNYDPRKFLAILRICKQYHIDIIHAHLEKAILGSLLATFFHQIPVVVHEHGPVFHKNWRQYVYRFGLRRLRKRARAYIAVSQAAAHCLAQRTKIPQEDIRVIHNPVDLDLFKPDPQARERIRRQLNVNPDDVVVGFVGRLDHVKGPDLLIDAMSCISDQSRRYILVLIGDGPQRASLQRRAEQLGINDRIRFLGFCNNVSELINAFDIGTVPSRAEAFGISALEFMCMKIPVVCSGVGGLAEIASNEVTSLVVDQNTPSRIAHCLERLIHDQTLRKKITAEAYRRRENFSVSKYVESIAQIYADLLRNS